MNKQWDTSFIEEFAQILTAGGTEAAVDDIEGDLTLIVEAAENGAAAGYTLSIAHPYEDMTCVYLLFPMFSGLGRDTADSIVPLTRYLNKFLSTGCFVISANDGDVFFRHSFVIDEGMDKEALFMLTAEIIDICAQTAEEGIDILAPVIEGRTPAEKLLNDDCAIIQQ